MSLRAGTQHSEFSVSLVEPWFLDQQLSLGTELFYKPRSHADRLRRFNAVTAEQIQRVAKRVLGRERLTVAVVGALSASVERRVRAAIHAYR